MKNELYFGAPTQVSFYTYDDGWCFGIAYRDEIICACCGGIFKIEEVDIVVARDRRGWRAMNIT